jgi:hypothetical protein
VRGFLLSWTCTPTKSPQARNQAAELPSVLRFPFATPESSCSDCRGFSAQHRSALGQGQALSTPRRHSVNCFLLNLGLILRIMLPSFLHQLPASFPRSRKELPVAIVLLHSFIGALAWLVASDVVLVAGTRLIPRKLRFLNYRRWMWAVFVLW